jgi:hypothetical protein
MSILKTSSPIILFLILFTFISCQNILSEGFISSLPSDSKRIQIKAEIRETAEGSKIFLPYVEDFCFSNLEKCFPLFVNFYDSYTLLLPKNLTNCNSTPEYDPDASATFKRENTQYIGQNTIFGGYTNFYYATEELKTKNNSPISDYKFKYISKIQRCSKIQGNGQLGLGYKNDYMLKLKDSNIIDKLIYSVDVNAKQNELSITIGAISDYLKSSKENINYCNITSNQLLIEYWGCNTDIYIRTPNRKQSMTNQIVLIHEIAENKMFEGEIVFAGMRKDYQKFFLEGLFDNNKNCTVNENTTMISCDKSVDYKKFANLLFVINSITYVFTPEDLFAYDKSTGRNVLKVSFPEANFNHIKFSQSLLISKRISTVVDIDNNRIGFYGFKTHPYRGESDDGSDDNNDDDDKDMSGWLVALIVGGVLSVVGAIAYTVFYFYKKRRFNTPRNNYTGM